MYWHFTFTRLLFILASVALVSLNGCASLGGDGQATPIYEGGTTDNNYPTYPPPSTGTDTATYHTVQPGETLYGIATRYGRNYQDVAAWNNIPPPYIISVGQSLLVSGNSNTSPYPAPDTSQPVPVYTPPPSGNSTSYHTVQQGESLYGISTRYGQNFRDVAAWNNIPPPYALSPGQRILVYPPTGAIVSSPPPAAPVYNPPVYNPPPVSGGNYHVVGAGDTLYSIAKRYGYSVGEVAAWNNLSPPYTLRIGMNLRVSPPSGQSTYSTYSTYAVSTTNAGGYHTVTPGETVYRIAKKYGHTIAQIVTWNSLYPPYTISVGQRLRVSPHANSAAAPAPVFKAQTVAFTPTRVPMTTMLSHHIVQPGENLQVIAAKYGITTHELILWNGIGSPYTVYPQQKLLIAPSY